jgi:hypothetical protein
MRHRAELAVQPIRAQHPGLYSPSSNLTMPPSSSAPIQSFRLTLNKEAASAFSRNQTPQKPNSKRRSSTLSQTCRSHTLHPASRIQRLLLRIKRFGRFWSLPSCWDFRSSFTFSSDISRCREVMMEYETNSYYPGKTGGLSTCGSTKHMK